MSVEKRLTELGIELPQVAAPVAAYVPAVVAGGWVYISGQLPMKDGKLGKLGKVGAEVTLEEAALAARQCAVNCLAALKSVAGNLDKIQQIVKVTGYVASAPGFNDQPKVINGASTLLSDVFGDAGKHARAAVGVLELPLGVCVEVDLVAILK